MKDFFKKYLTKLLKKEEQINPHHNTFKRMMRLYSLPKGAKQFFGTIKPQDGWANICSRQVRRAALRRLAFNKVTYENPGVGRRRRRSASRMLAVMMFHEGQAAWKPEVKA